MKKDYAAQENMLWNNFNVYWNPYSDYQRCYDQAEIVMNETILIK